MARRRRWTAAAWRHGCPGVVAAMWILSVFLGAFSGVLGYPPWGAAPVPPEPVQVMTDVTNQLGVSLLKDFACFPGNVAFSPYGAASVLIVLWEGARGESGEQLRKALGLPSSTHPTLDYGVIRLGMRDIHRHLRTYFAHDGYLNGLTFGNTTAANIQPAFKQILRFYGYNPDTAMSGKGEMVTPPWMKHMTTTTPFSELLSTTTSKNVSAESTTESSNVTSAGTTSTLATSTMSTTNLSKPTLPPPTTTKPSNTSTAKPAKTTKSPKTTTQKTTVATTTAKAETSTTETSSTLPTTKSNSTAATPARLTTATENISTTLGDLNDTSVPPLIDVTDYTSSTRVTRRMPGSSEQTFETYVPSMPPLTISNVGETPIPFDLSTPTTQNLQTAVLPETKIPFSSTLGITRSQQEPSLSSMLTTLGGGKTSDAGLTTAFIIMAMTTKEFSPANLTAMFPQSLNLVTNEQIMLQSTTPIPAESSTTQASSTTSSMETTTTPESSTVTFENLQSSYLSSTTPLTTEIAEATTEVTSEEYTSTQRNEDYSYSTQTEYRSTTEITTESTTEMETREPENVEVSLSIPTTISTEIPTTISTEIPTTISTEIPTTTDSNDLTSNPTEATSFSEEMTTDASETENPLGEEDSPKSRRKRLAKGEKNFFPELQLHLHGNAMLSADDKDMDTIWQKYQERFGLPQGPFQVFNQGQEPLVKWVPIIRMVKRLPFAYSSRLQAQALMLPLDDERYKLLLILPVGGEEYEEGWRPTRQRRSYPFQQNEARDLALLRLIDDLHSVPLREIVSSVQHCLVAATIPPFLIRGMLDLTPTLARMGVRDVFDSKTSDLSGMTNSTNLWVRGVEQTVSVAIDINGIFGRYGGGFRSRQDDQNSFRNQQWWSQSQSNHNNRRRHISQQSGPWGAPLRDANGERVERYFMATRPFLFFVIDTSTGVSLMAGKVTDPTSTKNS